MPLSATATIDTANRSASIAVSGGTAPYVVDAYPTGAASYRVRASWTGTTTLTTLDGEIPLNTGTQYVVTDNVGAQVTTATVTLTATAPVLSDALDPTLWLEPVVVSQPPNSWQGRTTWWNVLGRRDPFVSVAPLQLRGGDLVLRVEDTAARVALLDLLVPGTPLLLRTPMPAAVDDVTMAVESVREDLVLTDRPAGPRLLTITYQAVSRELGPWGGAVTRTYATVLTEAATYAVLTATRATYADVRLGTPPPVGTP